MKPHCRLSLACLLVLLAAPTAAEAAAPAAPPVVPEAHTQHPSAIVTRPDLLPLVKLLSYAGPMRLERTRSEATVPVPLSTRMVLKGAKLHLLLSNSAALIVERSHLAIALNDQVVAQVPLDGAHARMTYDIPLPPGLFKPEFNRLTFRVAQHYLRSGCEDPLAPELWTRIDTEHSAVMFDGALAPLAPRLADLGELFGPKEPAARHVSLVSAAGGLMDEGALKAGTLIAQGLALRTQYVPVDFDAPKPRRHNPEGTGVTYGLDPETFNGSDAVLFGTLDQLAPLVREDVSAQIKGPFLGVFAQDADPTKVLVVVSGRDEKELTAAATALAFADSPYPEAAEAVVRTGALPQWRDYHTHDALELGRKYELRELGFRTRTMNGWDREEAELPLVLPPDLYTLSTDRLVLHLHYAIGAGIQPGSGINVLVNRQFATSLTIQDAKASMVDDQKIELPMKLFRPGENAITLATEFLPEGHGPCMPILTDGLLMTLFADSSLAVPELPHFAEMPNLELFQRTGFPYTRQPDGAGTRLWVPSADPEAVGAAWTLAGRLAQTSGLPLFRLNTSFEAKAPQEDLLVVAPANAVPNELRKAITERDAAGPTELPGFQAGELGAARMPEASFEVGRASEELLAVSQVKSPYASDRTATVFTASTPRLLRQGMRTLVRPEAWGGLQGATTYWDPRLDKVAWRRSEGSYSLGRLGPALAVERIAAKYTVPFVGSVTALGALLAFGLAMLLRRRHHQQHPADAPEPLF